MLGIQRVMRLMTHLNIGAALGLVAWVAWSGHQVVTGQLPVRLTTPPPSATVSIPVSSPCHCQDASHDMRRRPGRSADWVEAPTTPRDREAQG